MYYHAWLVASNWANWVHLTKTGRIKGKLQWLRDCYRRYTTKNEVVFKERILSGSKFKVNFKKINEMNTIGAYPKLTDSSTPWHWTLLQSFADLFCSIMLLLSRNIDFQNMKTNGILGQLECSVWNSCFLLWGGLVASTWNLVSLTVER